jgi:hypothetical protein
MPCCAGKAQPLESFVHPFKSTIYLFSYAVEDALSWHFPSRLGDDFDSSLSLCGFVDGPLNSPKGALPKRFLAAHVEISVERPANTPPSSERSGDTVEKTNLQHV